MNVEVLVVGTELLLGPVVDTNSTWIGEQLAGRGIDVFRRVAIGDNHERIVAAMKDALSRADAVIVTGGLGPTDDDITREAAAEVMNEKLVCDETVVDELRKYFSRRSYVMAEANLRQAMRPQSARLIRQSGGTAPGLVCPVGEKVMYLVPGVPSEMREMLSNVVLDELAGRAKTNSVIAVRTVRCWGVSEAHIGELLAARVREIDSTNHLVRIAYLARGIEGVHVRLTVKDVSVEAAHAELDEEEKRVRGLLGSCVYGVDDQTMEAVVGSLLVERGLTLGVAESMTGGLVASRVTDVAGASKWFRGGVVSYASEVKFDVLNVPRGNVVTADCAAAMAMGVRDTLNADVGLSVTGVAGPDSQEGQKPGTVFCGIAGLPGATSGVESGVEVIRLDLVGDRRHVRESAAMHLVNGLRLRLLG